MMNTRICSKCKTEKPSDEFHKHAGKCRTCASEYARAWNLAHPERVAASKKAYQIRNAERLAREMAEYRKAHPEQIKATYKKRLATMLQYNAKWRADHPEQAKAHKRQERINNIVAYTARSAARRAQKMKATPAWANQFFMEEAYDLAQRRTKVTGIEWHVDHIVPLKSKIVCGLHVEHNLQVIPASQNYSKNNRYWPDMP